MVTNRELKSLYNMASNNEILTTAMLNIIGLNSYDITKLIKENIIKRESRGFYSIVNKNELEKKLGIVLTPIIREDLKFMVDQRIETINRFNVLEILSPVNKEDAKQIKNYLKQKTNLWYLSFENNDNEYLIAIKSQLPYNKDYNVKQIIIDGLNAYNEGNYVQATKLLKKALCIFKYPSSYLFRMIGLSCMRYDRNEEALKYLQIANIVCTNDKDFKENSIYINNLYRKIEVSNDFRKKDINFLGIRNIEEIAQSIHAFKGNIDLACQSFNLTLEQVMLIKIICARVYYHDGNIIAGDTLLKQVEKTKGKTKRVMYYYEETRKNKFFYKHREDEEAKKLAVILQNKKKYEKKHQ